MNTPRIFLHAATLLRGRALFKVCVAILLGLSTAVPNHAATYYVSSDHGSDSNNGLGPDASHGSNKPWKSLRHPLRTNNVNGDTIIAMGRFNETIQFRSNWTSLVTLRGDPQNTSGFRDSSGVLVPPMLSRGALHTAYTNDQTLPITTSALSLWDYDGYGNFRLENFICLSGDRGVVFELDAKSGGGSPGRVSTNCYWSNVVGRAMQEYVVTIASQSNQTMGLYFDLCDFATGGAGGQCLSVLWWSNDNGADWDMNVVARNSSFRTRLNVAVAGAKFNAGNGIVASGFNFTNCTIEGGSGGYSTGASSTNSGIRWNFVGCQILGSGANTAMDTNQVYVRDSQLIGFPGHWSNLLPGPNVVSNNYNYHAFGESAQMMGFGRLPRGSLVSGASGIIGVSSNYTSIDLYGQSRPATNSFGAVEVWTPAQFSSGY